MKTLITSFCLLLFCQLSAQIGFNVRSGNYNAEQWEQVVDNNSLFDLQTEVGIDYWFRLKEYRVEFMPELYASRVNTSNDNMTNYQFNSLGIAANTNFYVLDLVGDCDCPTFSKEGNFFTKGFFLSASPMFELQQKKIDEGETVNKKTDGYFALSLGAGLDIGITDLMTITPYVRYKFVTGLDWEGLRASRTEVIGEDEKFLHGMVQVGLRLGFRPDYIRKQNKYRFRR